MLDAAERVLGGGPLWTRAAVHLTRQSLEEALDVLWRRKRVPGLLHAPMRTQLLCLPFYLEPGLAHRVAWTWAALSHAGHHHGYEMAPPAEEVIGWIATVRELTGASGASR